MCEEEGTRGEDVSADAGDKREMLGRAHLSLGGG